MDLGVFFCVFARLWELWDFGDFGCFVWILRIFGMFLAFKLRTWVLVCLCGDFAVFWVVLGYFRFSVVFCLCLRVFGFCVLVLVGFCDLRGWVLLIVGLRVFECVSLLGVGLLCVYCALLTCLVCAVC